MKKRLIILSLIIILAASLRFFYLDKIPSGFIPEEVSTGWNAYSLLQTGRDEWNVPIPLIFRETGGFKLAFNSYLIIPVMAIFGVNELSVRIPTAIAGILSVLLTYNLVLLLLRSNKVALVASFLLTISPWHISMSRYSVDVNWGIPLFLSGLIFFLKSKLNPRLFFLSGFFFALTYYTYFNYVVFSFLFVMVIFFIYRDWIYSKVGKKMIFIFLFLQIIFLLPYISQKNLTVRFSQATSYANIGLLNRVNEHRGACQLVYPNFICKIIYNQPVEKIIEIGRNFINHYSTTVYFLFGAQLGLSGMPERWGFLYLFEFPLIVLGLVYLIRNNLFPKIFIVWLILYGLPSSLAADSHIWRMMTILPLPQIIGAVGLLNLISYTRKILLKLGIILIVCFFFLRFTADYFVYFPYAQGSYSYFGFRDLYHYLSSIENKYDNIIIAPLDMAFNQLYIYYIFYTKYDPRQYQLGQDVERLVGDQNWVWVNRIGKWYFIGELGKFQYPLTDNTLLVIDGNTSIDRIVYDRTLKSRLIHTIYYNNKNVAFKILELYR